MVLFYKASGFGSLPTVFIFQLKMLYQNPQNSIIDLQPSSRLLKIHFELKGGGRVGGLYKVV